MATKISDLTSGGTVLSTDQFEAARGGASRRVTLGGTPALLGTAQSFTALNKFTLGLEAHKGNDNGVAIGLDAAGVTNTDDSVNIGFAAGGGAAASSGSSQAVNIGRHAGYDSGGDNAVRIGHAAGQYAYSSSQAVLIGYEACRNPNQELTVVGTEAVVIGHEAGQNAVAYQTSVIIGATAGKNATNAVGSILIGYGAGRDLSSSSTLVIEGDPTFGAAGTTGLIYGEFGNRLLRVNGVFAIRRTTIPADARLSAGDVSIWFDQTNGAAKLKIKGKSADGTVVTGEVALA